MKSMRYVISFIYLTSMFCAKLFAPVRYIFNRKRPLLFILTSFLILLQVAPTSAQFNYNFSLLAGAENKDPVAVDDTIYVAKNGNSGQVAVMSNDSDPDSDPLVIDSITQGTNGAVVDNGNGTVTYTPNASYTGLDTFTYTISDGRGGTDTATVTVKVVTPFTWTGLAVGDGKWSAGNNWCGTVTAGACVGAAGAPTATDVAIFDETCTNCNADVNVNANIQGLDMRSSYTGTITQLAGQTITVGSSYWMQAGGTFVGGDSLIDVYKFSLTGGSFTATSGMMTVGYNNAGTESDGFTITGGSFVHNNGTVKFDGTTYSAGNIVVINVSGGVTLNNMIVELISTNIYANLRIEDGQTVTVEGDLTINDGFLLNGSVNLTQGDLHLTYTNATTKAEWSVAGGTSNPTALTFSGTAPQNYFCDANTRGPTVIVNSTSTVSPGGGTTDCSFSRFTLTAGTFTAPTGTLAIGQDFNNTGSDGDDFVINGGSFVHNGGTVKFDGVVGAGGSIVAMIVAPSGLTLNNLDIAVIDNAPTNGGNVSITVGHTVTVNGNLTISDGWLRNGTIDLTQGDLYLTYTDADHHAEITELGAASGDPTVLSFSGSTPQNYYCDANTKGPTVAINSTSNVSPGLGTTDCGFSRFQLTSGTFWAPTGTLSIGQNFNNGGSDGDDFVINGGTFTHNSGTVKFDSIRGSGGAEGTIVAPSGITLNNMEVAVKDSGSALIVTAGHTVTLDNDLIISDGIIINGTIEINGNLNFNYIDANILAEPAGTTTLNLIGGSDKIITVQAGAETQGYPITINKTGGASVTLSGSNLLLNNTGTQDLSILDGTLDMAGFDLTVNDQLNVGDGVGAASSARLISNCGTITAGTTTTNPTDGEIVNSGNNPNITINDVSATEGTALDFTVTLSEAYCLGNLTIDYASSNGTATLANSDYTNTNGTGFTFTPGQLTKTISVPTTTDATSEPDETLTMTISNNNVGTITDAAGTGTILNDDLGPFTWTGLAGDGLWSTAGNWNGGVVPGASDVAIFDNLCTNCNANIDVAANIQGLDMRSSYTGTITQLAGQTITVGSSYWMQAGGTFVGGDSLIDLYKFSLTGGSFTATSGMMTVGYNTGGNEVDGFTVNGGSFIHNNGTVKFDGQTFSGYRVGRIVAPSGVTLNNMVVELIEASARVYLQISPGHTLTLDGDLTINDGWLADGNINLTQGDLHLTYTNATTKAEMFDASSSYDPTVLTFSGSSPQNYFCDTDTRGPTVVVNSTSTVTPGGGTTDCGFSRFTLAAGSFTAPTGTLSIGENFSNSYSDGDDFVISGGSFVHNSGTIKFDGIAIGNQHQVQVTTIDVPSGVTLNNMEVAVVQDNVSYSDFAYVEIKLGQTVTLLGDLTISDGWLRNGSVNLTAGDLHLTKTSATVMAEKSHPENGSNKPATLTFSGSAPQNYYCDTGAWGPTVIVNSTSTVTPGAGTTDCGFSRFTLTAGSFTAPSGILSIGQHFMNLYSSNDDFVINGGSFIHNGGTLHFDSDATASFSWKLGKIVAPSGVTLNNMIVTLTDIGSASGYDDAYLEVNAGHTVTILGDLTINDGYILNGNLDVAGNINFNYTDANILAEPLGTTTITMSGSNNSTITAQAGAETQGYPMDLNKTIASGAVITLASNLYLNGQAGQDLHLISEDLNMAGFDLTIANVLTIEAGTNIYTNCGLLTFGSLTNNGGTIHTSGNNPDISIADVSEVEGTSLGFVVTLTEAYCLGNLTIDYASSDGTATVAGSDYTSTSGSGGTALTFTPGQLTKTITVPTTTDALSEDDETLTMTLSNNNVGSLVDGVATGTLQNDDLGPFTWTGLAGDGLWMTGGNWNNNAVPGVSDVAVFDNLCTNCNANINANIDVGGIDMRSTYAGTITQQAGFTVTVGTDYFTQKAGTFVGGDSQIDIDKFSLTGGSFTATSGTMLLSHFSTGDQTDGFTVDGGTFVHNSGTIKFTASGWYANRYDVMRITVPSGVIFNNMEVAVKDTSATSNYDDSSLEIATGNTITVEGDLTISDGWLKDGAINLDGNLILGYTDADVKAEGNQVGDVTTLVTFTGSSPQTYSCSNDAHGPAIDVNSSSTVSPAGGTTNCGFAEFGLTAGTFTAPSGTLTIGHPQNIDNTDGFIINGGTFVHNSGTIKFEYSMYIGAPRKALILSAPSGVTLNNLEMNLTDTLASSGYNDPYLYITPGHTVTLAGDLTIHDGNMGGQGSVFDLTQGDLHLKYTSDDVRSERTIVLYAGDDPPPLIKFTGSSPQNYYCDTGAEGPSVEINSTSTVSPGGGTTDCGFAEFTLTAGTFTAPTGTLDIGNYQVQTNTDGFSINGGTFTHNNGTVRFSSSTYTSGAMKLLTVSVPSGLTLNNMEVALLDGLATGGNEDAYITITSGHTLTLLGDLTINDGYIKDGTIDVSGNVNFNYTDAAVLAEAGGTTAIVMSGEANTNLTVQAGAETQSYPLTINKDNVAPTPKVTQQTSNLNCNTATADMYLQSGTYDMNGLDLTINDALTLDSGTVLNQNGGTLTYGTLTNNGTITP